MTEIWKGIRWTLGIAIGLSIIFGIIVGGRAMWEIVRGDDDPERTEKQTQEWLEDCVVRSYGISKTDFRFKHMLKEYTVCHAERDGVSCGSDHA